MTTETTSTKKKDEMIPMSIFAIISLVAILVYQFYGIFWPMYIPMALIVILIGAIFITSVALLSGRFETGEVTITSTKKLLKLLMNVVYFIAAYIFYLVGYQVFAIVATIFLVINIVSVVFEKVEKE